MIWFWTKAPNTEWLKTSKISFFFLFNDTSLVLEYFYILKQIAFTRIQPFYIWNPKSKVISDPEQKQNI
jgi:hypothetical protein